MCQGENLLVLTVSANLIDWYPNLDKKGNLWKVIWPREGYLDSALTECGPPALLTDKGILLLYNGKNSDGNNADPNLPKGTYSIGQVLIDAANPKKVLKRLELSILINFTSPANRPV